MPTPALLAVLLALAVFLGLLSFELPGTAARVTRIIATVLAGVVLLIGLVTILG